MDNNDVFLVLAGFSSATLLARSIQNRVRGWMVVSGAIVALSVVGALWFRSHAGYLSGSLWALFIVIPLVGQRWTGHLADRQRYGAAARLAAALRVLHPADGWWDRPRFFKALDLSRHGHVAEATALLERLEKGSPSFAREARVHRLRIQSRWEDVLAWMNVHVPRTISLDNASLLPLRLRALGETGDIEGLCAAYGAAEPLFSRGELAGQRNVSRLFVLAFAGRASHVAALYKGPLRNATRAVRDFWIATADLAADPDDDAAKQRLRGLLEDADRSLSASVMRRLERPPIPAAMALSEEALAVLTRIERELEQEDRYGARSGWGGGAFATMGLMAPSALMFAAEELLGGSTNEVTLQRLGAVWPEAVLDGEVWRLGAATILHYGTLHLVMNLLGLWVLGPYVEFALGRARYVALYVASGVGAMLTVVLLSRAGVVEPQLLVGASGGIMGLVGATIAVLLRGFRADRSPLARRRLLGVCAIVVAQTVFDVLTPQVSFLSHFGGALLGFMLASLLAHRVTPRRAKGGSARPRGRARSAGGN